MEDFLLKIKNIFFCYLEKNIEAKYPQLCELCSSKTSPCDYTDINRHAGALNCLINKGQVAYVSLQDAQEFFSIVCDLWNYDEHTFFYLCE